VCAKSSVPELKKHIFVFSNQAWEIIQISMLISFALRCWKVVSAKLLLQVCAIFWSLQKPQQDSLLWSIQAFSLDEEVSSDGESESSETEKKSPSQWYLGGHPICRKAFAKFLGVGSNRLDRTRGRFRGLDERLLKGAGWEHILL
jgi:hypothetical protein